MRACRADWRLFGAEEAGIVSVTVVEGIDEEWGGRGREMRDGVAGSRQDSRALIPETGK